MYNAQITRETTKFVAARQPSPTERTLNIRIIMCIRRKGCFSNSLIKRNAFEFQSRRTKAIIIIKRKTTQRVRAGYDVPVRRLQKRACIRKLCSSCTTSAFSRLDKNRRTKRANFPYGETKTKQNPFWTAQVPTYGTVAEMRNHVSENDRAWWKGTRRLSRIEIPECISSRMYYFPNVRKPKAFFSECLFPKLKFPNPLFPESP